MITLSRYSKLETLWNDVKQNNVIPDEFKYETEEKLLKNKFEINVNYNDHRFLEKEDLHHRILECYTTIYLVDSLVKDSSICLQNSAKLLVTDPKGVIISCQSEDFMGYCCPAAEMVNNNNNMKSLVKMGNVIEVNYDNGICSQLVPIFNEYGEIQFYCGVSDTKPISFEMSNILFLTAQLVQQRYKSIRMLEEYTSAFIEVIPEYVVILDENDRIVDANKLCLELLEIKDKQILQGMHINTLISANESIYNSDIILNANYNNMFSIQFCSERIVCQVKKAKSIHTNAGNLLILLFNELDENKYINDLSSTDTLNNSASAFDKIIGNNSEINNLKALAKKAAKSSATILIEGESGTGKELFAEAIHRESQRQGSFVAINCGGIPSELIQSELFGYEEGAFTGAKKRGSPGKFEIADGGTLFLDEIGEMPINMQVNLLRFLQDKTITRIGGYSPKKVDVRIIAATNRDIKKEVEKGNFREDLYYRLNVINLKIPSLRKRKEDIPLIATFFIKRLCEQECISALDIDKQAMKNLINYNWPGNARELENIIERAFILREGNNLIFDNLPSISTKGVASSRQEIVASMEEIEKEAIENHLRMCRGNISETANILGITRQTLYRKIKDLNIDRYAYGS